MTPEISEFSYGFALTNELVGWLPVSAAPIFPSLVEEGKEGGGYDVKLDTPAVPLYLQFKRADRMTRKSAKEIAKSGANLSVPFYRFQITEAGKSDQHDLLLSLDSGDNLVFYAAPRFHKLSEINAAWLQNSVASRSVFIAPSEIGELDWSSHTVAYDEDVAWLCSEPKKVPTLTAVELLGELAQRLEADKRPLKAKVFEIEKALNEAELRGEERMKRRIRSATQAGVSIPLTEEQYREVVEFRRYSTFPPEFDASPRIPKRQPKGLDDPTSALRRTADRALRTFDAQLVIVQPLPKNPSHNAH